MPNETHDPIDRARSIAGRALPPGAPHTRVLQGEWLGHPLHPMLTDLPVGFWTSAWILDLFGGESGRRASQRLVGAGVMSVLPTALAGGADWTRRPRPDQRLGLLHAGAVAAATSVYAASWVARRRGSHRAGVVLGHVGAGLATFGGYLGGHLAFDPPANDQTRSDRSRDGEQTPMADPDDRTAEPAVPEGTDGDAERPVDGGAPAAPEPLDGDREVDTDDEELVSDASGAAGPQPRQA